MTKHKIGATFAELTRNRSADGITVKDIVDACGVTRQTFYYHFQDIEDVIDWIFSISMKEALERVDNITDIRLATRMLVEDVVENGDIIEKLLVSKRHQYVESTLFSTVRGYLKSSADRIEIYRGFTEYEEKIALDLYSHAITGVLLNHIVDKKSDVEDLVLQIYMMLTGELAQKINMNYAAHLENEGK